MRTMYTRISGVVDVIENPILADANSVIRRIAAKFANSRRARVKGDACLWQP